MVSSKRKLRLTTIITLAVMFVLTLGLAIGMLPSASKAQALTFSPSSIFSAGSGSEVGHSEKGTEEGAEAYLEFSFTRDGSKVYYRRDLALKWFEAAEAASTPSAQATSLANPGAEKYFSMSFAFASLDFTKFTVSFEASEENISKDGISTNAIVFEYKENALTAELRNTNYEEEVTATHLTAVTLTGYTAGTDVTLRIDETRLNEQNEKVACVPGEFSLYLSWGADTETCLGQLTNVGGNFLEYRSSAATTPSTPITFEVNLPEPAEGAEQAAVKVDMKSLNGQTFVLNADNQVEDNANPVLVFNESIYSFRLGQRYSLTHEAIDVCHDVDVTRSYYMLKKEDGKYVKPNEYNSDDYHTLTTSTFFMPTSDDLGEEEKAYVSIRFKLDDGTNKDYYVYLTWYAANDSVVTTLGNEGDGYWVCSKCGAHYTKAEYGNFADDWTCPHTEEGSTTACGAKKEDLKEVKTDYFDYIVVDREAEGPAYVGLTATENNAPNGKNENVSTQALTDAVERYQDDLDKAAEGVSAGDGAYIYLPSLRGLITSDYADYRNLRFSIYYYKPGQATGATASSATSLRYSGLRLEVDEEGQYRFRVIAQDAAGNAMKYYDEDGELVTLTSSNVWDIEGIPEFNFSINYDGPSIEDAGEQSQGHRDDTYSISDFDVIALDGYKKDYELYYFDQSLDKGNHTIPSYSTLVDMLKDGKAPEEWIQKCLHKINVYNSDVTESDSEWVKTDNAYYWDPDSSLSFVPQETGYYYVKVTVTDARLINTSTTAYQVIDIRNPTDYIPGSSDWIQSNLTAVVLFSISGVLLIAIVVLFVVNPSDKKVEEVDLTTLKGKKSSEKPKKPANKKK